MKRALKQIWMLAVMLLTFLPASGYDFEVDDIYYYILSEEDRTVAVTSYRSAWEEDYDNYKYKGDIVIPSRIMHGVKTYTVAIIENSAFFECDKLTSVDIPVSVSSIGSSAFNGCSALTTVDIPGSVTSIGKDAFRGCSKLSTVNISDGVSTIGLQAFQDCSALTSVVIPGSVTNMEDFVFSGCDELATVIILSGAVIGFRAFDGCSALTTVDISDGVSSIGDGAFAGCSALTTVDIPGSVTSIEQQTFEGCSKLTTVNISDGVSSIGYEAFAGCSALTTVDIPGSVTSIGSRAFEGCSALSTVNISDGVTSIGYSAFEDCSALTSVDIPCSVTSIGTNAFDGCNSLTDINVNSTNNNYASINGVLYSKDYQMLIRYPEGKVESSFVIPCSVETIESGAFVNCVNLTEVDIPSYVASIGEDAFRKCANLNKIYCRAIVPPETSGYLDYIFDANVLLNGCLYIPIGTKSDYEAVDPWRNFWNIVEMDGLIVQVESVDIYDKSVEMNDNETYQLSALILPENASYKTLLWQSSDEDIATVDENGLVTSYDNSGTVEISATTCDGSNLKASCTVTVAAKSGIGNTDAGDKIDVRSADGNIYIINKPKGEDCFVYNISGTFVSETKEDAIYGLEQGVYVVRIGAFIKKVVL